MSRQQTDNYTWQDLKTALTVLKMQAVHLEIAGRKARTPEEKKLLEAQCNAALCSLEIIKWRFQRLKDKR